MKKRKVLLVLLLLLAFPAYYLTTGIIIQHYARALANHSSGSFSNSGDKTRFLLAMGERSIDPLLGQFQNTELSTQKKIHLAWILSSLGDHTYFSAFIDGLNSDSGMDRYMAAFRMKEFPFECLGHIDEIVEAGKEKKQHTAYSILFLSIAQGCGLNDKEIWTPRYRALGNSPRTPMSDNEAAAIIAAFNNLKSTIRN